MKEKETQLVILENSIIPIYEQKAISGEASHEQAVSARELWAWLESKQDFSTWVKKRIEEVDAIENTDYYLLHKKMEQVSGAKYLTEYVVTLDIAKEMAMLERNDKGKVARRYFIEAEKRYREMKLIRARAKAERRLFTDIIRDLLPESPNKKWAYKSFTDLIYKHVTGYNAKQLRELYDKPTDYNVRDLLTPQQLKDVLKYESIIQGLLQLGQDYQGVKAILDNPQAYLPQNKIGRVSDAI